MPKLSLRQMTAGRKARSWVRQTRDRVTSTTSGSVAAVLGRFPRSSRDDLVVQPFVFDGF